jgi:hypothetical protein
MIEPVMRLEGDSFFAGGNSGVPCSQFEVSTAEQVVSLGGGLTADFPPQCFESLIDAASGKKVFGRVGERERQD